jgi:hypothetical protein
MDIMDRIAVSRRDNVTDLNIDTSGRLTYRDRNGVYRGQGERVSSADVDEFLDALLTPTARAELDATPIGTATVHHRDAATGSEYSVHVYREDLKVCVCIRLAAAANPTRNFARPT